MNFAKNKFFYFITLIFIFFNQIVHTNEVKKIHVEIEKLPIIKKLSAEDIIFMQYSEEVEQSYKNFAKYKKSLQNFFVYVATPKDSLLTIAARCSIPLETIATLNSIENQTISLENKKLILPTSAGIFVRENATLPYEMLLYQKFANQIIEQKEAICYTFNGKEFYFFENERFNSTERAFFLDSSMKMPIKNFQISSLFGMRTSPITGKWKFHNGIDLAASEGEDVFACQNAKVLRCSYDDFTYGNYIVLDHGGGLTSIYAHLSKIVVKQGETVFGGKKIGNVGHTGMATGPHLHFEIRVNDVPSNPQKLLQ